MKDNIPYFPFYSGDWRKHIGVQSLTYHDKGVWVEILCLMNESEQRGKLLLNGKPIPNEVLARILGLDKQKLEQTLENLISFGVAGKCETTGALQCEWMVKEEHIRQIRREAGKKGGNPNLVGNLVNQNPNQKGKQKVKQKSNQTSTLSSSSSSSPLSSSNEKESGGLSPPTTETSGLDVQGETGKAYLARKQTEFPQKPVLEIYRRFVGLCGSERYPNLRNTRRAFDKWLENEDEDLNVSLPEEKFVVAGIGELK